MQNTPARTSARWSSIGLVVLLVVICGSASAEPILSATEVFGPRALDSGFPITLVLPQYDGLSGPLLGVQLTLHGAETTQFRAVNDGSEAGTVTAAESQSTLTLMYMGSNLVITTPIAYLTGGPYTVPGETYIPINVGTPVSGSDTDFDAFDDSDAVVQAFRTGPVTFTLTSSTHATGSYTGGDMLVGHKSTADGWVKVDFITGDVPEPATMALIGSSLLGLALIGRKRFI